MSAALKPRLSASSRPWDSRQTAKHVSLLADPAHQSPGQHSPQPTDLKPRVRHLQAVPAAPVRTRQVQWLAALNAGVSVLTSLLVATALGGYGYTVYVDRQLDQSSARLNSLQRSGQQLVTVNEVLKNHMAEQAESPSAGLQPPRPANVIFLKPAQRRTSPNAAEAPSAEPDSASRLSPLGY
jgi:hypothetical protein